MPEEEIVKSNQPPVEETHEIKPIDKAKEGEMARVSPSFDSALADKKPAISTPISIKAKPVKKKQPWGAIALLLITLIVVLLFVLNYFKIINIGQYLKFGADPTDGLVIDPFSTGEDNSNLKTPAEKRDIQRKADLNIISQALENYKTQKQQGYPQTFLTITEARLPLIEESNPQNIVNLSKSGNVLEKTLVPDFIKSIPQDPKQGNYYSYTSDGLKYKIVAVSETDTNCDELDHDLCLLVVKNNP